MFYNIFSTIFDHLTHYFRPLFTKFASANYAYSDVS